jgi:hypothetical protein
MTSVPDVSTLDFRVLAKQYHDEFEKAFVINPFTGNIVCIDNEVEIFYCSYADLISTFTGFKPPSISLLKENPKTRITQLTRAYAYAFIAYRKINNLYIKRNNPGYTSELFIEELD